VTDEAPKPEPEKPQLKQPKQLKISMLRRKDEFHPGGFLFKIIDNDGTTVLKEYWDADKGLGTQFCRNWLKVLAGEELEFYKPPEPTPKVETEQPKEPDAESKQVG
jgi:hypothetical protein